MDALESRALPQYVAIAAELRKVVNASSVLAVVPAVKDLRRQLFQYKQCTGQMHALIEQLCATLTLGSAEALIAERMQTVLASAEQSTTG